MEEQKKTLPLITVIVPVYNKEKYVTQLINSIKAQRYRGYECFLIDDGSTDDSGLICDMLTEGDSLFTVIHIQNGGVSHARNTGLELAVGEFITFVDSDDEIPEDYLQRIADDIRRYSADIVIGAIKRISESRCNSKIIQYPYENRVYALQELLPNFAESQASCGVFGWCVNKTFKRELIGDCRFHESLTLCEDFDFYLRVYPRIQTIYFDNSVFYHYLSERSNFSSFVDSKIDYLAQVEVNLRYKKFLEEQKVWNGSNETIVSDAIQRFIFLSIFHSPMECFDERFEKACMLFGQAGIRITEKDFFRKGILSFIANKQRSFTKTVIKGYRLVRRIIRGELCGRYTNNAG